MKLSLFYARRTNMVVSPGILGSEPNFIAMLVLGLHWVLACGHYLAMDDGA